MSILGVFPLAGPAAMLVAALVAFAGGDRSLGRLFTFCRVAGYVALVAALVSIVVLTTVGPVDGPVFGVGDAGLGARVDALSVAVFTLVSFVGVIVLRYSIRYLDGDARHALFLGRLCLTLAAVQLLVIAPNLYQFVLAWIATSFALHTLLVFYEDRRGAVVAARKKFVTARVGDALIVAAAILVAGALDTVVVSEILERAASLDTAPAGLSAAAVLIALAALLKSAQFPTHGWLIEVMETPTPVSALLHAGIINAGGFVVMRFADVVVASPLAMHVLAVVGGFTALFGGVVMLTQPAVKNSLAWSTVAQMGFMLFQCGVGAFSIAALHLVAHSLYKAHAFLSSGSVIDIARTAWVPAPRKRVDALELVAAVVVAAGLYAGAMTLVGTERLVPAELALGMILVLGLTHLMFQATEGRAAAYPIGRSVVSAAVVALAFALVHTGANLVFEGVMPSPGPADPFDTLVLTLALVSFATVTLLQILAPLWLDTDAWRAAYVHVSQGLYMNALFDRLVGAWRRPTHPTSGH